MELGFTVEQTDEEVQRCLNCDVQTVFEAKLCIECDACIDICPVDCLTITPNGEEAELRARLKAPAKNVTQAAVRLGAAETYRARHGQRRRPLRALRPVRRTLPDRGLGHAEVHDPVATSHGRSTPPRCQAPAERLKCRTVNNFAIKIATVNGTGSASANTLLMKSIFRSGVPGDGQELLPVEHPGPAHLVRNPRDQGFATSRARERSTSWSR